MENTLTILETKKTEIKKLFAPTLTDLEFEYFMQLAISLKANPFNREIYATKYKSKDGKETMSVFCGRDFYRRVAQEQPTYESHVAMPIYENDIFSYENGVPKHSFSLKNRGALLGAYACLWKKGVANPFFTLVYMKEYAKNFGSWTQIPNTMITKVAESQVLRMAFQGIFAGTYNESEEWEMAEVVEQKAPQNDDLLAAQALKLKEVEEKLNAAKTAKPATLESIDTYLKLIPQTNFESNVKIQAIAWAKAGRFQHEIDSKIENAKLNIEQQKQETNE